MRCDWRVVALAVCYWVILRKFQPCFSNNDYYRIVHCNSSINNIHTKFTYDVLFNYKYTWCAIHSSIRSICDAPYLNNYMRELAMTSKRIHYVGFRKYWLLLCANFHLLQFPPYILIVYVLICSMHSHQSCCSSSYSILILISGKSFRNSGLNNGRAINW